MRPHVSFDEAMRTCELVAEWGFDAVTPVEVGVLPDTTLSRGGVPSSLWKNQSMKTRLRKAAPSWVRRSTLRFGSWWGGRRNPFEPVWNRHMFKEAKRRVSIPVFAVGGIRTGAEARQIVGDGEADMVGFGRPFYAQDDLAEHILGGADLHALCQSSNLCVPAQMLGMKGVCYNPEVKKLKKESAVACRARLQSRARRGCAEPRRRVDIVSAWNESRVHSMGLACAAARFVNAASTSSSNSGGPKLRSGRLSAGLRVDLASFWDTSEAAFRATKWFDRERQAEILLP